MKRNSSTVLFVALISPFLSPFALAETAPEAQQTSQKSLLASFDSLADTLHRAKEQVTQAVTERDRALADLAGLEKTSSEQARRIAELEKRLAESEKRASESEQRAEKLDARLAVGRQAHERLAGFRDRLDKTLKEFTALEGELSQLREAMKEPREVAALTKENEQLKTEAEKTRKRLEKGAASRQQLQMNLAKRDHELTNARNEVERLHQQQGELKKQAEKRQQELASQLEEREKALASLREKLEAQPEAAPEPANADS